jgi:hypothetical protein
MNLTLLFLDAELLALTVAAREEIYRTRTCHPPFVLSIVTSSRRQIRDVVLAFRRPQRPLLRRRALPYPLAALQLRGRAQCAHH